MESGRLLDNINSPKDLKGLTLNKLQTLCGEIRDELIKTVSMNGGHLASNLGVVELTVAIHRVFDSPKDQIVWDVSHQCYTHKLLTGRRENFGTIRKYGGISGFTKYRESDHDPYGAGHSSTSISAAAGLARAKTLCGDDGYVVAVIGDGALSGGLAYEGLNNAGRSRDKLIIILNDNKMSISKNVGAMARHLALLRIKPWYFKVKDFVENILEHTPVIGVRIRNALIKSKSAIKSSSLSLVTCLLSLITCLSLLATLSISSSTNSPGSAMPPESPAGQTRPGEGTGRDPLRLGRVVGVDQAPNEGITNVVTSDK